MKELLVKILSSQYDVAFTPDNMNVAISHARFASNLKGSEDILVLEYGESKPGDINSLLLIFTHRML